MDQRRYGGSNNVTDKSLWGHYKYQMRMGVEFNRLVTVAGDGDFN
jgi:hypothetical protein